MGGSNEFYDKFSVRYHLSVILKQLWEHPAHRRHIIVESANTHEDAGFIRFVNMLINDTTFLLDESLDALKAIHETQEAMKDTEAWQSQPQVSAVLTITFECMVTFVCMHTYLYTLNKYDIYFNLVRQLEL